MKTASNVCPCCGRTTKAIKAIAPVDTAAMSTAQLYAHYKKTAPVEDVRFFLNNAVLSDALRADTAVLLALAPQLQRADLYRRLRSLQDDWRRDSNVREDIERAAARAAELEDEAA